jgi:hypothetical protein
VRNATVSDGMFGGVGILHRKLGVHLTCDHRAKYEPSSYCIGYRILRLEMDLDQVTGTATSAAETHVELAFQLYSDALECKYHLHTT